MSATEQKLLIKLAKDLAWKLQGTFLARVVMEEFIFEHNPPSSSEKACYKLMLEKCNLAVKDYTKNPLHFKPAGGNYDRLLSYFVSVFDYHSLAMQSKDAIEKLSSRLGASPEELNEIAEEEFELDSSFRNEKRACGDILSTLLLNASKVAGRTDEELIKLIIERCAITIEIGPIPGSYDAAMAAIRSFEGTSYFSVSGT